MEEEEGMEICLNCYRGIPRRNFMIHSVHCSRKIKVCSVCKEPVPLDEIEEHNEKLHSLVPCAQCGEMVRGTDMEDHLRDSCAHTLKSCRYCSLELPRCTVPSHERYCGARTELCAGCNVYVMLRDRQLHLDSDHRFVRGRNSPLHVPRQLDNIIYPRRPRAERAPNSLSRDIFDPSLTEEERMRMLRERSGAADYDDDDSADEMEDFQRKLRLRFHYVSPEVYAEGWPDARNDELWALPMPEADAAQGPGADAAQGPGADAAQGPGADAAQGPGADAAQGPGADAAQDPQAEAAQGPRAGAAQDPRPGPAPRALPPVANVQQQFNPNSLFYVRQMDLVQFQLNTTAPPEARAARQAASRAPPPDPRRDLPYRSAMQRRNHEQALRNLENQYNLAADRPPVMDPAANLEMVRMMGARRKSAEEEEVDYSRRITGRVWHNSNMQPFGEWLDWDECTPNDQRPMEAHGSGMSQSNASAEGAKKAQAQGSGQTQGAKAKGPDKAVSPAQCKAFEGADTAEAGGAAPARLVEVEPMTPDEFMARFNELQLMHEPREPHVPRDIRYSLAELRRGLNEVTAPYSNPTNNNNDSRTHNNNTGRNATGDLDTSTVDDDNQLGEARALSPGPRGGSEESVLVPCEFCCLLQSADTIIEHQTECSEGTVQVTPMCDVYADAPFIPCEVCNETIPHHLFFEHQDLCGTD